MQCAQCDSTAVARSVGDKPEYLCQEHFLSYFENKVEETMQKFSLAQKSDNIAVACSGGKDSITVLLLLHRWGYNVTGLLIDEGIAGYRDKSREEFEAICKEHGIPTSILEYDRDMGASMDTIVKKNPEARPCTICGVFRRSLLHRGSKGFDILATGHNLDDEAQGILMNIFKGQPDLLKRMGPVNHASKQFVKRIKPLYLCSEKEIRLYTLFKQYPITYMECPNARRAFREEFSHSLNKLETEHEGVKWNIVQNFLERWFKEDKVSTHSSTCERCGDPASRNICKACQLKDQYGVSA